MLHIHTLTLGLFQVNCYIVCKEGSDRCVVIDPGYDAKKILAFLEEKNLHPDAILLTHGHFDHVGAVKDLAADTDCKVFVHELEHTMPHTITAGKLYATDGYADQISVAGMDLSVLHTPGHTPGSVCLIIEDAMFSGDTLFAGSCGRTDLPGGDWATIQSSLRSLKELSADYRVFPGHGESTTLTQEKQLNPYMR
jgi:glyoxylase-like metal-dependent hydrolase (beta-lactamase superfamily II)